MKYTFIAFAAALALAACTEPGANGAVSQGVSPLDTALSGKTLINDTGNIVVHPDGQLSGAQLNGAVIEGTWNITGGQWCRTLTLPDVAKGKECQDVILAGNQATFVREDGSTVTFTIQ